MSAHILMCPPDFYEIDYEINPWMDRSHPADRSLAKQQWQALYEILQSLGAKVSLLEPIAGL
ncbi:MAG TPA: amidinotransferase, partial [Pirellulaceae bacterium]|nr:amidinotransferase [Pirellulaceae bacterium]